MSLNVSDEFLGSMPLVVTVPSAQTDWRVSTGRQRREWRLRCRKVSTPNLGKGSSPVHASTVRRDAPVGVHGRFAVHKRRRVSFGEASGPSSCRYPPTCPFFPDVSRETWPGERSSSSPERPTSSPERSSFPGERSSSCAECSSPSCEYSSSSGERSSSPAERSSSPAGCTSSPTERSAGAEDRHLRLLSPAA